jgi:NurA-like 5'-3' nuclease
VRSKAFLRPTEPKQPLWYEAEGHTVTFFYLRVDDEIARVELPCWLAARREGVDLLHAVLVDQCSKGFGYPVALQEAHEQAVITTVDRRSFAALLERAVAESGIAPAGSAKSRSKTRRSI